MKNRAHDALRLDVAALATDGATVEGVAPIEAFERLADCQMPPAATPGAAADVPVTWSATGEEVPVATGAPQVWLALTAHAELHLQCQRCLAAVDTVVDIERRFRFVADEETAARLDDEQDEVDVLALPRVLDLRDLVEDELLLALPLVPRHDVCPEPPKLTFGEPDAATLAQEHPFAALAAWRKGDAGGSSSDGGI